VLNNSHIQVLVILLFSNPTHKTKTGTANNSHIQVLAILLFSNPTHKTKIGIANKWEDATNSKLQPTWTNQTI
jgi:hypothetical protein